MSEEGEGSEGREREKCPDGMAAPSSKAIRALVQRWENAGSTSQAFFPMKLSVVGTHTQARLRL